MKLRLDSETRKQVEASIDQVKACLFNLVIYLRGSSRIHYFQEFVQSVIEQFPCRVIFIQADEETGKDFLHIRHAVEARGSEQALMICDQVYLEVGGLNISQIPLHLLPHLVPDLPIYLIWGDDPSLEEEVLLQLQKYAVRLIFDSDSCCDFAAFCQKIENKLSSSEPEVVDMNWIRLSGWKLALEQVFDTEEKLEKLNCSTHLALIYNDLSDPNFERNCVQAFYLQAWLASRLGWDYVESKREQEVETLIYKKKERVVEVHLVPQEVSEFSPGSILAFEAITEDDHFFTILRSEQAPDSLQVKIASLDYCGVPFTLPLSASSGGPNFIRELLYSPPSPHYKEMIKLASKERPLH